VSSGGLRPAGRRHGRHGHLGTGTGQGMGMGGVGGWHRRGRVWHKHYELWVLTEKRNRDGGGMGTGWDRGRAGLRGHRGSTGEGPLVTPALAEGLTAVRY